MKKKALGQFYTTNYDYIFSDIDITKYIETTIIEPFAGNGDLLNFIKNRENCKIEAYDEPKQSFIIQKDTLQNPPDYKDKFILTNPPYLAKNKTQNKEIYKNYKCDDLYKCFILSIIDENNSNGGLIIVPLNFISSIRKCDIDIRKNFLKKYFIKRINIFEEQVFKDTKYSVCSILFLNKNKYIQENTNFDVCIYPSKKLINISLNEENNYTIGGEIYNLPYNPVYKIQRATRISKENITNIVIKCIDDNINSCLGFKIVSDPEKYIDETPNLSGRSYAVLTINKHLSIEEQQLLVHKMNNFIEENRKKYNSLFLTNYRESNTIARKRISFDLAFSICNYFLSRE